MRAKRRGARSRRSEALRNLGRLRGGILAGLVFVCGLGCASGRVANLDAYPTIPMSKVHPYPTDAALRDRAQQIVILDRPSPGLSESELAVPRAQVRRSVERLAVDAGATVLDRSLEALSELESEQARAGAAGGVNEVSALRAAEASGADVAVVIRFSKHRFTSEWKPPFKFLWQGAEEVKSKPGTCIHLATVDVDLQLVDVRRSDRVSKTMSLAHRLSQKNENLDPQCPIATVTRAVLFENVLDQALSCLEIPLGARLSPRGHVLAHRKAPQAERHIYRISLGSSQGMERGDAVEIRREQQLTGPLGELERSERVIAVGEVTDQVAPQWAWVAIDPAKATEEVLDGDLVRPVVAEGLLSSLSGPNCNQILTER